MSLTVALAQLNPTIGDITGNAEKVMEAYQQGQSQGADLVVGPELGLIGYPAQDLLHRNQLLEACEHQVSRLADQTGDTALILGYPRMVPPGHSVYNSLSVLRQGAVKETTDKCLLPTYDVFDEDRYFQPGRTVEVVELFGRRIGLTVCEDLWPTECLPKGVRYDFDPVSELQKNDPDLVVNVAASPFWLEKQQERQQIFKDLAGELEADMVYCNTVGANDEIIFDGRSLVVGSDGTVITQAEPYEETITCTQLNGDSVSMESDVQSKEENALRALELGLRDYIRKCGFDRVLLGLSGGIDSTLTAYVAARALGPKQVLGISMPTRFTSEGSRSDAQKLAENLGISFQEIEIEPLFKSFMECLDPVFDGMEQGTATENLQARIRGTLLMAISNYTGQLLLATGNKSELSVGYCTLYGDMAGGLAPIGDVPKTLVYDIARYINEQAEEPVIPDDIITKPPSAELKPDQTDQDVLPPYDILDDILEAYIVEQKGLAEIETEELDEEQIEDVIKRVDRNEFKRQQAAPVLKITTRSFGMGRHMPIAKRIRTD